MNIKELYNEIIPPDNYESRRDFNNEYIIDRLNFNEKSEIEEMLLENLINNYDLLIIETLAYLKSKKSVNVIEKKLTEATNLFDKIVIAWCLFSLDKDKDKMINIAYDSFLKVENDYTKTYLFYYLVKFNNSKLNSLVESYTNSKNILLSHNSKTALKY